MVTNPTLQSLFICHNVKVSQSPRSSLRQHKVAAVEETCHTFIMKDAYSSFLCCLLKFKSHKFWKYKINTGSFLVPVAQDGSKVTRTWAVRGTSHLTSCPPILSLLPLRGAPHNSLPAHRGILLTPQTRLREAEDHLRETEGIIRLCYLFLWSSKSLTGFLVINWEENLSAVLMYSLRGDRRFNFSGCRGKLLPALINIRLPCQQETTPQSTHNLLNISCWDSDPRCL